MDLDKIALLIPVKSKAGKNKEKGKLWLCEGIASNEEATSSHPAHLMQWKRSETWSPDNAAHNGPSITPALTPLLPDTNRRAYPNPTWALEMQAATGIGKGGSGRSSTMEPNPHCPPLLALPKRTVPQIGIHTSWPLPWTWTFRNPSEVKGEPLWTDWAQRISDRNSIPWKCGWNFLLEVP